MRTLLIFGLAALLAGCPEPVEVETEPTAGESPEVVNEVVALPGKTVVECEVQRPPGPSEDELKELCGTPGAPKSFGTSHHGRLGRMRSSFAEARDQSELRYCRRGTLAAYVADSLDEDEDEGHEGRGADCVVPHAPSSHCGVMGLGNSYPIGHVSQV